MSKPKIPQPAKLIASLIFRAGEGHGETGELLGAKAALAEEFGPLDFASPVLAFTQTRYYNREMGEALLRQIVSFKRLVDRGRLADIKLFTNSIEKKIEDPMGRRTVNIDPGLLSLENLVLATGKNFTHRIYLRDGIFAEVTLLYQNKRFTSLPWTYPDYAAMELTEILTGIRQQLVADLRGVQNEPVEDRR